jgi:hypothetical protein
MKRLILIILLLSQSCFGAAIAQWKMNDNAETADIVDSVGSHTGTFIDENGEAAVTSDHATTGKISGGLEFDGTNDYATFLDHADFSPTLKPFSITAWISLVGQGAAAEFEILNKMENNNFEWDFRISGNNLMFVLLDQLGSQQIGRKDTDDYSNWEDSGFIFVAATYNGGTESGDVKLYLNGEKCDDENEENDAENFVTVTDTDTILRMGYYTGSPNKASGVIDNVIIFNTELSQSEISSLYNNGSGTENASLAKSNPRLRYSNGYRYKYRGRYNF